MKGLTFTPGGKYYLFLQQWPKTQDIIRVIERWDGWGGGGGGGKTDSNHHKDMDLKTVASTWIVVSDSNTQMDLVFTDFLNISTTY